MFGSLRKKCLRTRNKRTIKDFKERLYWALFLWASIAQSRLNKKPRYYIARIFKFDIRFSLNKVRYALRQLLLVACFSRALYSDQQMCLLRLQLAQSQREKSFLFQ